MPSVDKNGDHTYTQGELGEFIRIQRQVGAEPFRHALRHADENDWHHLFRMLPDSGHGRFWKAALTSVRAAMINRT